jgi:hypothetical protein
MGQISRKKFEATTVELPILNYWVIMGVLMGNYTHTLNVK